MEKNRKHFRKRDAILSYLRHTDQHPSAETVYAELKKEIPDLSLGTVYRNIALFKQQGLIQSLGNINGVERFDGTVVPHVHFVCSVCGEIRDLTQLHVPQLLCDKAASEAEAVVEQCMLTFLGTCSECAGNENQINMKKENLS